MSQSDEHIMTNLLHRHYYKQKSSHHTTTTTTYQSEFSSRDIRDALFSLANEYPEFTTLENAQESFHLPSAGDDKDCPFDRYYYDTGNNETITTTTTAAANHYHDNRRILQNLHHHYTTTRYNQSGFPRTLSASKTKCFHWILTIHPPRSTTVTRQPALIFMGGLDGTDRVGPAILINLARRLLSAVNGTRRCDCHDADENNDDNRRHPCNDSSNDKYSHRYLTHLIHTRRIIFIPTVNTLGYSRFESHEDGLEVETDFPYDLKDDVCMRTIAARVVNEVMRREVFQLGVVFMKGEGVRFGGGGEGSSVVKEMIESQYHAIVDGGHRARLFHQKKDNHHPFTRDERPRGNIIDWAYAASWDANHTTICHPTTHGSYPPDRTMYDNDTLRVFTTAIGTTHKKLIPRYVELAFMMMDIVEPYVILTSFDKHDVRNDGGGGCRTPPIFRIRKKRRRYKLEWTVGGGFEVDDTGVIYGQDDAALFPRDDDDGQPPSPLVYNDLIHAILLNGRDDDNKTFHVSRGTIPTGRTRWHPRGPTPRHRTVGHDNNDATFVTTIDGSPFLPGESIAVMAFCKLDGRWASPTSQSHWVNLRTNPRWNITGEVRSIQGRWYWFSEPLILMVNDTSEGVAEVSSHFPSLTTEVVLSYILPHQERSDVDIITLFTIIVTLLLLVVLVIVAIGVFLRGCQCRSRRVGDRHGVMTTVIVCRYLFWDFCDKVMTFWGVVTTRPKRTRMGGDKMTGKGEVIYRSVGQVECISDTDSTDGGGGDDDVGIVLESIVKDVPSFP